MINFPRISLVLCLFENLMIFQLLKRLPSVSMCNLVHVGILVYGLVWYQGTKTCITKMYTHNIHRVFGVLQMCHILVSDIIAHDNYFSNAAPHVVFYEYRKTSMEQNRLLHRKSLHFCASHHHPTAHNNLVLSNYIYLPFYVFTLTNYSIFMWWIIQVFL